MVYVHVPFCRSFCTYCDFYSTIACRGADAALFEAYARGIEKEAQERSREILASADTDTLYIGGGTPSVLPLDVISRITAAVSSALGSGGARRDYREFTIEVNPEDIVQKGPEYVRGLLALGVNRVSMGVQSLSDDILRWMNRRHSAEGAREAFGILRDCGVQNISVDVIFGISILDDSTLARTLEEVLEWAPEHISAYQLSIEEGSELAKMVAQGRYTEACEEQCRGQYDFICRTLREAGYVHYEISNWACPGCEAVHNSAYWRRAPYVGLGPGAHSLSITDGASAEGYSPSAAFLFREMPPKVNTPLPDAAVSGEIPPKVNTPLPDAAVSGEMPPKVNTPLPASDNSATARASTCGSQFFLGDAASGGSPGGGSTIQRRSWNSEELSGWTSEGETLSEEEIREERLMLGLRTREGVDGKVIAEEDWFVSDEIILNMI